MSARKSGICGIELEPLFMSGTSSGCIGMNRAVAGGIGGRHNTARHMRTASE